MPVVGHEDVATHQKTSAPTNAIENSGEQPELVFRECRVGPQDVAGDEEDLAG